jgi:hypothetical protein
LGVVFFLRLIYPEEKLRTLQAFCLIERLSNNPKNARKRKASRALSPKRSDLFVAKINCGTTYRATTMESITIYPSVNITYLTFRYAKN